ncbi:hypothetical protein AK812_SmicGene27707 [Symbiodinium microadriaticum]|uniref:Uncharacterized protein n=1 Tax=Symbiodinium microadriaticum TaxID=2951 RepID=A0A1Q9D641_SYMMI|nr:hypothetical protein AK812_SmicGene27707 [Symbiodinium microadriaticum]
MASGAQGRSYCSADTKYFQKVVKEDTVPSGAQSSVQGGTLLASGRPQDAYGWEYGRAGIGKGSGIEEPFAPWKSYDISAALEMLHRAHIVHANIHADNVMLRNTGLVHPVPLLPSLQANGEVKYAEVPAENLRSLCNSNQAIGRGLGPPSKHNGDVNYTCLYHCSSPFGECGEMVKKRRSAYFTCLGDSVFQKTTTGGGRHQAPPAPAHGHNGQPLRLMPYREHGDALLALQVGPVHGIWPAAGQPAVDAGLTTLFSQGIFFGAYSQGPLVGLRAQTTRFPMVSRLLNAVVYTLCGVHSHSTLFLARNRAMGLHSDRHNHKSVRNVLIPLSVFAGGQLFVESEEGDVSLDVQSNIRGHVHPITLPYLAFDAQKRHSILPWSGCRMILGTFHIRDADRLPLGTRNLLRALSYPLHKDGQVSLEEAEAVTSAD